MRSGVEGEVDGGGCSDGRRFYAQILVFVPVSFYIRKNFPKKPLNSLLMKKRDLLVFLCFLLLVSCSLDVSPDINDDTQIAVTISNDNQPRDTILPGGIGLEYRDGEFVHS